METLSEMNNDAMGNSVYEQSLFFAQKLRELRLEKGLTQQKLARKLAISRGTLANYEHGRAAPPLWMADRVAKYFDVDVNMLLGKGSEE